MNSSIDTLPPGYLAHLAAVLPAEEVDAFAAALRDPAPGIRANTLRLDPEALAARLPLEVEPLLYPPEGFTYRERLRLGRHPDHAAGLYYLQDPGAMCVGALVDPQPGERVLDLSAAPGGKATHLAARMRNEGILVANDVHRTRARELAGNLERLGVHNALVLNERPDRLVAHFGPWFDRVLLDAPCSGESMFHKSAAAREEWSEAVVAGCARRQRELIRTAAHLVRPGGLLVYSTCTFSPAENEEVIADFLAREPDFTPAPLLAVPGAEAVGAPAPGGDAAAYRLWPHRVRGAGHFVAAFRRRSESEGARLREPRAHAPADARAAAASFFEQLGIRPPWDLGRLALTGRDLYHLPPGSPDLEGLSIVRPGLWLGSWQGGRFEPAHALALALPLSDRLPALMLDPEDERVSRYLEGHPIEASGPAGWIPVGSGGFLLGWGKRVGAMVKNHYPKGLRWR